MLVGDEACKRNDGILYYRILMSDECEALAGAAMSRPFGTARPRLFWLAEPHAPVLSITTNRDPPHGHLRHDPSPHRAFAGAPRPFAAE